MGGGEAQFARDLLALRRLGGETLLVELINQSFRANPLSFPVDNVDITGEN
ncbi:MAG: hypothetical protein ACK41W_18435 [Cyanobacteriota bacterium]